MKIFQNIYISYILKVKYLFFEKLDKKLTIHNIYSVHVYILRNKQSIHYNLHVGCYIHNLKNASFDILIFFSGGTIIFKKSILNQDYKIKSL